MAASVTPASLQGVMRVLQAAASGEKTRAAVRRSLKRATLQVHKRAVQYILGGPKSGVIATDVRGNEKQRSAPGQPPANITGHLAAGVVPVSDPAEVLPGVYQTSVISTSRTQDGRDADYGKFLEYGTKHMEPRPFLERSLYELTPQITADILHVVKEAEG